jgi:hypothetical protein
MSEKKPGKVIHVDHLTIHAKDVRIIHEQSREHHEERRNPWNFFGPRRRPGREVEEEHHMKAESSSEVHGERREGPRWM